MSRRGVVRDKAHRYGLKNETVGRLGVDPASITGGVLGAVVGGWAAKKAQEATGRTPNDGRKRDQAENKALTLLGAAVGGLAVNAAVERWKRGRDEEASAKQKEWDEKHGRRVSRGSNDSKRNERRQSEGGRHRRDRDDSESKYSGSVGDWEGSQSGRGRRDDREY
jgi:hypothetical protein